MNIPRLFLPGLLGLSLATSLLAANPTPAASSSPTNLDFGDFKSSTLTAKAWKALGDKDYASAMGYTQKCIDMFKGQAVQMQKGLTAEPDTSDKEKVFANWALNDVGTCYFIQAKALEDQGNTKDALADYKFLADNLSYAKCWDTKGWFWSPAGAAKERVSALQFDSIK
ncbi:MAG TPA: hypothetical protein VHY22_10870 [Chthoniobacteraceae bacterium]|nr:hypothetical protein [Chthoniobacteraceae bacterium]